MIENNQLDQDSILSIIQNELQDAETSNDGSLESNREDALDYYLANKPAAPGNGRSGVVSTDVADAIEWILPQIMESLTSHGSPVKFDPISPQDEPQADLETDFTHHVFMSDNEGFLNLYTAVKDALMQKNGIFKICFDDTPDVYTEEYEGITDVELEMLSQDPTKEIVADEPYEDPVTTMQKQQQAQQLQQQMQQMQMQQMQDPQQMMQMQQQGQQVDPEQMQQQMQQAQQQMQQQMQQMEQQLQELMKPAMFHDVRVKCTVEQGQVKVEVVPPEEFMVNSNHNSTDLSDARFTAHKTMKTRSDLIEEGYDPEVVYGARKASTYEQTEQRFGAQGETTLSNFESEDEAMQLVEVVECFMHIDANGDGIAELMKITVLGDENDAYNILDMEEIEEIPFVGFSTINMPHKFYGLSIYDRLKELQDAKTSLWRNILDNIYLQNNREKEVVEGQVNIDDLLISRPGGIKRVKAPGMIRELQVQPVGADGFNMLQYMDTVRTGRVGVSPDSQGQDMPVANDTAHGMERLMTAKEKLTGLMIRLVAETALKPAYRLVRDLLVRHQNTTTAFLWRDQWQNVSPTSWGRRSKMSVKVGTGTGDDMRKQAALTQMMQTQAMLYQMQGQALVGPAELYKTIDDWADASGIGGALGYLVDPSSPEGQQKAQQAAESAQQQQQMEMSIQQEVINAQKQLAQAENIKAQADMQANQVKMQMDVMKTNHAREVEDLNRKMEALQTSVEYKFKYDDMRTREALELTKLEMEAQQDLNKQYLDNKKLESDRAKKTA